MTKFVDDRDIFEAIFLDALPKAKKFVWIATADIKDLHVPDKGGKYVSLLAILSDLIRSKVTIRYIHAKEPGPRFRESYDKYPNLVNGMERALCPRNHMKAIIVDGKWLYMGSANMTGAGVGAKSEYKRNFETGIISTDSALLDPMIEKFDQLWMGQKCDKCQRRKYCPDPIDEH
jgi:phosphatidylserine/phosphatidylglycerophosphate/cardiolipin synthase-like enzyme